jgi:hypothetical protein
MAFPLAAAAIIAGGAIVGALGARSAAKTQANAARDVAAMQGNQYATTRADLMPWQEAGQVSLAKLRALLGFEGEQAAQNALTQSPAYQFNLEQGLEAINKGAAARGNFYAPATLRDIGRFSQGLASNEFGNIYQRLFGLSEAGRGAAVQSGQLGVQSVGSQGEALLGGANALAAGRVGTANAITGGLSDAYNAYLLSTVLGGQPTITGAGSAAGSPFAYGFG